MQLIITQIAHIRTENLYENLYPYDRPNKNNNTWGEKIYNNTHKINKLLRNSVARFAFVYRDRDCGNFEGKTRSKHHQTRVYRKYCINQKLGKLGELGTKRCVSGPRRVLRGPQRVNLRTKDQSDEYIHNS